MHFLKLSSEISWDLSLTEGLSEIAHILTYKRLVFSCDICVNNPNHSVSDVVSVINVSTVIDFTFLLSQNIYTKDFSFCLFPLGKRCVSDV